MRKKVFFVFSLLSMMCFSLLLGFCINFSDTKVNASVSDYDINGDGYINTIDQTLELRYLSGTLTAYDVTAFDLNDNGIINRVDYEILKDYIIEHMLD